MLWSLRVFLRVSYFECASFYVLSLGSLLQSVEQWETKCGKGMEKIKTFRIQLASNIFSDFHLGRVTQNSKTIWCVLYVVWRAKASSPVAGCYLATDYTATFFRSSISLKQFPWCHFTPTRFSVFHCKKEQSISSSLLLTATLSLQRSEHTEWENFQHSIKMKFYDVYFHLFSQSKRLMLVQVFCSEAFKVFFIVVLLLQKMKAAVVWQRREFSVEI